MYEKLRSWAGVFVELHGDHSTVAGYIIQAHPLGLLLNVTKESNELARSHDGNGMCDTLDYVGECFIPWTSICKAIQLFEDTSS